MFTGITQFINSILQGPYSGYFVIALLITAGLCYYFLFKRFRNRLETYFQKRGQSGMVSVVRAVYPPLTCYVGFVIFTYSLEMLILQISPESSVPINHMYLSIAFVLALTWFLLRLKSNIVKGIATRAKQHNLDAPQIDLIDKMVTVGIATLCIALLLQASGSSLTALIAFGGISGLALAFASQEVISSFFGGFMIYLTRPFNIGDQITLPERNIEGHVEEIGWYRTKIRTLEKCPIYVPNSIFTKIVVVNTSRMSHRRIKELIGIRYSDMPALKTIINELREMLHTDADIDQNLPAMAHFSAFGSSSLDIHISAYTTKTSTANFFTVKENILFKVMDILNKNGAEVAFPTTSLELPGQITFAQMQNTPSTFSP